MSAAAAAGKNDGILSIEGGGADDGSGDGDGGEGIDSISDVELATVDEEISNMPAR